MGVIAYECMYGKRPFQGKDRKAIRDDILSKQVQIKQRDLPPGWSKEAMDFINKLIQRKPQHRLGQNGPDEVKLHPWFREYDWNKLYNKEFKSPFIPRPDADNFDDVYTSQDWKDANSEAMLHQIEQLRRPSVQKLFEGYYHDEIVAEQMRKEEAANQTHGRSDTTKPATTVVVTKGEPPLTSYTDNMMSDRDNSNSKRANQYMQSHKQSFSSSNAGAYSAYQNQSKTGGHMSSASQSGNHTMNESTSFKA